MLGIKENVVIFLTTLLQVSRLKENCYFMISSFLFKHLKKAKIFSLYVFFVIIILYVVIDNIYYIEVL
jgi:hypothetical protein